MSIQSPGTDDLAHWHRLRAAMRLALLGWAAASLIIILGGMLATRAAGEGKWPEGLPSGAMISGIGPLLAFFLMLGWLARRCHRLDSERLRGR